MLCAELETLEAQLDDIITALEAPDLTPARRGDLEEQYKQLSREIREHHEFGHRGSPCYEE
jgi:hypothetical protein